MPKVSFFIDEKKYTAEAGINLLEACINEGIEVPHLCYDPRIKPFGSCRMCFVDIGSPRGPVAACGTPVTDGMKVITNNEALKALRKTALELLMSEHCGDCIAPCQLACPANIDIQGYIAFIDSGQYKKAAELIKEKMPLPSICGRVCPRFCEDECRRNIIDEPVNICDLKRFAGDFDLDAINSYKALVKPSTGYRIAVVGGGPAGLTAAYYLGLEGHEITLYDQGPELGGMLRYGIPEYRLPKALLDKEINMITDICKEVKLGQIMGRDFSLEELQQEYNAVFLGLGSQSAQGMGLENEDIPGVLKGIDFLRDVIEGNLTELGGKVAVIGGGNTAMDAARTAIRLGAKEVYVIYRRTRDEMPAEEIEIQEAEDEGVIFHYLANPTCLIPDKGSVGGMKCIRMELGEPDSSGRRRPIAVDGSDFHIDVDTVIMAIGQKLDKENANLCKLPLNKWNDLNACSETGCVSLEGVFAAGDAVTGPATVVEAIGAARKSARAIDMYVRGKEIKPEKKPFNCSMGKLKDLNAKDFADKEIIERVHVPHTSSEKRKVNFKEYNHGLDEESSLKEAKRCLSCGCQDVFDCTLRKLADEYDIDMERLGTSVKRYPIKNDNEYIQHDPNKCILCANCVRICQEVQGVSALGLVNRGYDTIVKPTLGLPLEQTACESCGQCVSACPTGALTANTPFEKPGPWKDDSIISTTCVKCGIGCNIDLHIVGDKITSVTSPLRQEINDGNLCIKASFEYDYVNEPNRIQTPYVKEAENLKEVDWDIGLKAAGEGLKHCISEYGPESVAVLVSPELSNEEGYLVQKLARESLGIANIESTSPVFNSLTKPEYSTLVYEDIVNSDFVIVVNTDLTRDYPIIAQKLRKAKDNNTKIALINIDSSPLEEISDYVIHVNTGKLESLFKGVLANLYKYKQLKEGIEISLSDNEINKALIELPKTLKINLSMLMDTINEFMNSKKPIIIIDGNIMTPSELRLIEELLMVTDKNGSGKGLLPMYKGGNIRGHLDLGVNPIFMAGGVTAKTKGKTLTEIKKDLHAGSIKGLLIIGNEIDLIQDAVNSHAFKVVIASTWQDGLAGVDVLLPMATFAETEGTVINCEGRLQRLTPAFSPIGGNQNGQIIIELSKVLGKPIKAVSIEDIQQLIK